MSHHVRLLALLAVLLPLPPAAQGGLGGGGAQAADGRHPSLLLTVSLNAPRRPP